MFIIIKYINYNFENIIQTLIPGILRNNYIFSFQALHLDDNNIRSVASATFMSLENLETLTLARNKLRGLAPRMFLLLNRLKTLDLSGNPIQDLDPEVLKDLPDLRIFRCAKCEVSLVRSLVYKVVSLLETLDLKGP